MTPTDFDPPIQNLDAFDFLGVRNDGGIDAMIVAATAIDGSPETLRSLTTKVRNYVLELTSKQFLAQHPDAPGKTRIIIKACSTIDVVALGMIESLSRETRESGVELSAERVVA